MTERENKPQDYHKTEKINFRVTPQKKALFEEIGREFDTEPHSETLERLMQEHLEHRKSQGSQALGQTQAIMPQEIKEISERCKKKGCLAYPHFDAEAQEMLCVFPFEGKEPKIIRRSIVEFKACSDTPILVSVARKRDLEQKFERQIETLKAETEKVPKLEAYGEALRTTLIERDNEHAKDVGEIHRLAGVLDLREKKIEQLERKLQPTQEIINKKEELESKVSDMQNTLLKRDETITILETDNEQLRKTVEELSHDTLVETNKEVSAQLEEAKQLLKVQEDAKDNLIGEYKTEIEKIQALADKRWQTLNEVVSKTNSVFRDFKQFLPKSSEPYHVSEYINAMRKTIEQFEGYLETMMATPKDNILRGS